MLSSISANNFLDEGFSHTTKFDNLLFQFFNKNGKITLLDDKSEIDSFIKDLFGLEISIDQIRKVMGLPSDSTTLVEIDTIEEGKAISITSSHPHLDGHATGLIYKDLNDMLTFEYVFLFAKKSTPDGFGTFVMLNSILACKAIGIQQIVASAVRGKKYNGYYTFPRWGFNAKIDKVVVGDNNYVDLQSLCNSFIGRNWWKNNGWSIKVNFNLSENNDSSKLFKNYLVETGFYDKLN